MVSDQLIEEYQRLSRGSGYVTHRDRTLLRFTGPDAAKFLHNFCTADVNRLENGGVTEGFALDSRGKTISFGHVLRLEDQIFWSAADRAHGSILCEHFDKYIIRENVVVENVSDSWIAVLVPVGIDQGAAFEFDRCTQTDTGFIKAYGEFAGPCCLHLSEATEISRAQLGDEMKACSMSALDMLRLEKLTPWFGAEIGNENLPQELRRDETAISFNKGCYLGQETVAKIDAIGHVNKFFVGLKCGSDSIAAGSEIRQDGKNVGIVKNVAFSPILNCYLGLGYVKRQSAQAGNILDASGVKVEVLLQPVA